jgi:glycine cleavage system regulatory protein
MATVVLTFIGDDRPGLVDALAGVISEHGGNWEESRMAQLASKFAGILLISVPDAKVEALSAALKALEAEGLLHITAERSGAEQPAGAFRSLSLELIGQDHPGIVRDIAHALASRRISIEELESETRSASMAGGVLFYASLRLQVPQAIALDELRALLESLADELMVDIDLEEAAEDAS